MSDSYRSSDDFISRKRSGYRSLNDCPAVREWNEAERLRKAAATARRKAAKAAGQPIARKAA